MGVIELPEVTITSDEDERREREIAQAAREVLRNIRRDIQPDLRAALDEAMPETREGRPTPAFGRADPVAVGEGPTPRYALEGIATPEQAAASSFAPPPSPRPSPNPAGPMPEEGPTALGAPRPRMATQQPLAGPTRFNAGQALADRQGLLDAQAASDQQRRMRLAAAAIAGALGGVGPDRMARMMATARQSSEADPYRRALDDVQLRTTQREQAQAQERAQRDETEAMRRREFDEQMRTREAERLGRRSELDERSLEARVGAEEAETTLQRDLQDPASLISRADQAALRAARDAMGGAMAQSLPDETIETLPAETIRRNPMLSGLLTSQRQLNAQAARRPAGRAGGGGGAASSERRDRAVQAYAERYQIPVEEADALLPRSGRALDSMLSQISVAEVRGDLQAQVGEQRAQAAEARSERMDDPRHRIGGWVRLPGAPVLEGGERAAVRNVAESMDVIVSASSRLQELQRRMSAAETAQARARVLSENAADAKQWTEQLQNALRVVGNYGVPQAAELARMERLVPDVSTVDGFLNQQALLSGLSRVMTETTRTRLRVRGYVQGNQRVRVRRDGQVGTVSARNVRPTDEVIYE